MLSEINAEGAAKTSQSHRSLGQTSSIEQKQRTPPMIAPYLLKQRISLGFVGIHNTDTTPPPDLPQNDKPYPLRQQNRRHITKQTEKSQKYIPSHSLFCLYTEHIITVQMPPARSSQIEGSSYMERIVGSSWKTALSDIVYSLLQTASEDSPTSGTRKWCT